MEELINELKDWLDKNFVSLGKCPPGTLEERLRQFIYDICGEQSPPFPYGYHDHRVNMQEPHNHTHFFEEPESISHLFNFD